MYVVLLKSYLTVQAIALWYMYVLLEHPCFIWYMNKMCLLWVTECHKYYLFKYMKYILKELTFSFIDENCYTPVT